MDVNFRPTTRTEDMYTYTPSTQIAGQTGCIGYLRADMDTDGNGFFSSWNDIRKHYKTDEFKEEFDKVINKLREDGGLLQNRKSMAKVCYSTPESKMGTVQNYYGFRVDTEKFSYLMRVTPDKGEYNLYCYCYRRDWLDDHMKQAERGIRFIDSSYNELFRIPDGGKIRVTSPDGIERVFACRYVDDYHLEVDTGTDNIFHICEFAEHMEDKGNTYVPLRDDLPSQCYSTLGSTDEIIVINKGDMGYYPTSIVATSKEHARSIVDEYNAKLGVTRAQEEAMRIGSMFGFNVPGADPRNYDGDGRPINNHKRNRGDAR